MYANNISVISSKNSECILKLECQVVRENLGNSANNLFFN